VLPSWTFAVFGRQMLRDQIAHVGKRFERQKVGDGERSRRGATSRGVAKRGPTQYEWIAVQIRTTTAGVESSLAIVLEPLLLG